MGVRGSDGEGGLDRRQGEPGMMGPKGEQVKHIYIVYFRSRSLLWFVKLD
jgi:hypothetical protein